jgi:hypothetical protein
VAAVLADHQAVDPTDDCAYLRRHVEKDLIPTIGHLRLAEVTGRHLTAMFPILDGEPSAHRTASRKAVGRQSGQLGHHRVQRLSAVATGLLHQRNLDTSGEIDPKFLRETARAGPAWIDGEPAERRVGGNEAPGDSTPIMLQLDDLMRVGGSAVSCPLDECLNASHAFRATGKGDANLGAGEDLPDLDGSSGHPNDRRAQAKAGTHAESSHDR